MLAILHHRLTGIDPSGRAPSWKPSPNHNADIAPRFLMFHYTRCSAETALHLLTAGDRPNPVSAHLLVDRDGSITQMVPFNRRAWHAGKSSWAGLEDLNSHAIGVEVVNEGFLLPNDDGSFACPSGNQLDAARAAEVVRAWHKLPEVPYRHWDAYTPAQLQACEELAALLVSAYHLADIIGHDDVAPFRKEDPGPAFPLAAIRAQALQGMRP